MAQSRLEQRALLPGDIVPKYRYRTFWTGQGKGILASQTSAANGSMTTTELTTGALASLEFDAAADNHAMLVYVPEDGDIYAPINLRIVWSSDQTTAADSYTWDVKYREITLDTTSFNVAPSTALDTTIAADTNSATANASQKTAWGTINGGKLTGTHPDYFLHLLIDPSSLGGTISDDVVLVWAVQMRYQPKEI